jgi:hypothetical protein
MQTEDPHDEIQLNVVVMHCYYKLFLFLIPPSLKIIFFCRFYLPYANVFSIYATAVTSVHRLEFGTRSQISRSLDHL